MNFERVVELANTILAETARRYIRTTEYGQG